MLSSSGSTSSTCPSQSPIRAFSSSTQESYDADIESFICSGSEQDDFIADDRNESSFPLPLLPLKMSIFQSKTVISSKYPCVLQEPMQSFESVFETETSTSDGLSATYTDSDFVRVPHIMCTRDDSVDMKARPQYDDDCESGFDTTNDIDTLKRQYTPADESYACKTLDKECCFCPQNSTMDSSQDQCYKDKEVFTKEPLVNVKNQELTKQNLVSREGKSADWNCSCQNADKPEDEPKLTDQEIMQKQRDLRDNLNKLVNEARKNVRHSRLNQSAHKTNPKRSTVAGKPRRGTQIGEPQKQNKNFQEKRWQTRSESKNPRRERKKQETDEIDRNQLEILITGLKELNLQEQAVNLQDAWEIKESHEKKYDMPLKAVKQSCSKRMRKGEKCRMKEEEKRKHLEEIRRIEEEKKEKQDVESRRKAEEEIQRREKNKMLWESYHKVVLSNSISRSFTFSYFPKLRPEEPLLIERAEIATRSARVPETRDRRKQKHGENCHPKTEPR